MKTASVCHLVAIALLVSACASAPSNYQALPKVDKLEWRRPNPAPAWVDNGKDDDEQYYYFVGSSREHSDEQDARAEARRNGGLDFVLFSGVEVRVFSEYLQSNSTSGGQVANSNSSRRQQQELAEAFFRGLKAEAFYVERYLQQQGEVAVGSYYKAHALVRVPKSEYQAVQQWRAEQERQEQEERDRGVRLLATRVDEAHRLAASSQLLAALSVLQGIRNDQEHARRPERSGEVQRALLLHSELLASLRLQLLSEAEQSLLVGARAEPVRVQVWFSYQGQSLPAAGIALTLLDSNGKSYGNQRSDEQGAAQFVWDFDKDAPGAHSAYLALDTDFMTDAANKHELADLAARRLQLKAIVADDLFAEQYWSGEFAFNLRFAPEQNAAWRADAPVEVFAECAVRCYVAVYGWDERAQSGQLLLSSQRRLAKQRETKIGLLRFGAGSYRLIALARTTNTSADMQPNTSLSRDELALLLKQVRAGTFSKVERHWLIDAAR